MARTFMGSRFTIRAEHPAYARRIVRSALSDVDGDTVETAALLASELVTNAMVYAGADPQLFVDTRDGHIYVEVRNSDSRPALKAACQGWTPRGWGLDMINALATSWGSELRGDCETIWFSLAFSHQGATRTTGRPRNVGSN